MEKQITITNQSEECAVIEIEGVIGVPEKWQFEDPQQRIATYETFRTKIEQIKKIDAREVVVNIRSTGGNVNDALLIFDALQGIGAKITTRCFGYVASAATIIAQAASEGQREISGNSLYLIHRSVCTAEGNSQELARTLDILGQTDRRIAEIYAGRAGKDAAGFVELMGENNGNGRWLSPDETVEMGLADRIIAASPIKADARQAVAELGLPPVPKSRKSVGGAIARQWSAVIEKIGLSGSRTNVSDSQTKASEARAAAGDSYGAQAEGGAQASSEERANGVAVAAHAEDIAQNAAKDKRSTVKATATEPKEDPAPQEITMSQNETAYLNDLRKFIEA